MKAFWGVAIGLLVAFLLLFLVGERFGLTEGQAVTGWVRSVRNGPHANLWVGGAIFGLLAADLFLPVPSSVVMTLSGCFLGFAAGLLVAFAGAMTSAVLGFALCRRFGRRFFERVAGGDESGRVARFMDRYGVWAILLSRSVPMLTEVMSCLAGLSALSFRRFAAMAAAGTLPVCAVYAWAGSRSVEGTPTGIGWAVVVAFAAPAAGFAVVRLMERRRGQTEDRKGREEGREVTADHADGTDGRRQD